MQASFFLKTIKLRTKIISGFVSVLALMAAVIGVYQYAVGNASAGFRSVQASTAINTYAARIETLSFQADRNELAFLSSKDVKYAEEQHGIIKELVADAEAIQKLAGEQGRRRAKEESAAIIGHAQRYLSQFDALVAAQKEAGLDQKSGLQGRFREAAHTVETSLTQYDVDDLYISLLLLRHKDKEFYRVKSDVNLQALNAEVNRFRLLLAKSGCVATAKSEMETQMGTYREALAKFQETEQNLQKAMEYHNMSVATAGIEKAIASVRAPGAIAQMSQVRKVEKDFLLRRDPGLIETLHQQVERFNKLFADSAALPEYKEAIAKNMKDYVDAFDAMTGEMSKIAEAQTAMEQTVQAMATAVKTIVHDAAARVSEDTQTITAKSSTLSRVAICIELITMVVALIMGVVISRTIANPIDQSVHELNTAAALVTAVSAQISTSSQSLAEGAAEQASALEETSASMEEIAAVTRHNSDNAGQADGLMKDVVTIVQTADRAMTEMQQAMEQIAAASTETSKIVKTINEIAFQTNLLALNAAVEAARAGEAGAGFAVVAEEVRNLAMRSAEAANSTATLIDSTMAKVSHGKLVASDTNDAFREVSAASAKVGGLIAEIASASKEQAAGLTQINQAIGQMDTLTQQNSANAEESADSAKELHAQAARLLAVVDALRQMVDGGGSVPENTRPPAALPPSAATARLGIG